MTLKILSVAMLWVISHFPFANDTINLKIKTFAQALPKVGPGQVDAARKYIKSIGLDENSPWVAVMNECVYFSFDPTLFNRMNFVNRLGDATRDTHDGTYRGISQQLTDIYQTRALLNRLLPK
jgi:hypothetical protein